MPGSDVAQVNPYAMSRFECCTALCPQAGPLSEAGTEHTGGNERALSNEDGQRARDDELISRAADAPEEKTAPTPRLPQCYSCCVRYGTGLLVCGWLAGLAVAVTMPLSVGLNGKDRVTVSICLGGGYVMCTLFCIVLCCCVTCCCTIENPAERDLEAGLPRAIPLRLMRHGVAWVEVPLNHEFRVGDLVQSQWAQPRFGVVGRILVVTPSTVRVRFYKDEACTEPANFAQNCFHRWPRSTEYRLVEYQGMLAKL